MTVRRVALLTAGGFAPCLSAAVGDLIERYTQVAPEVEIILYQYGLMKKDVVTQRFCVSSAALRSVTLVSS